MAELTTREQIALQLTLKLMEFERPAEAAMVVEDYNQIFNNIIVGAGPQKKEH